MLESGEWENSLEWKLTDQISWQWMFTAKLQDSISTILIAINTCLEG